MPQDAAASAGGWAEPAPTALLVLADGLVLEGFGIGAEGEAAGEVCFNTAMTGYQEILTDPSYAGQVVTFTFPHVGNVGTNEEDLEGLNPAPSAGARGVVLAAAVTTPLELARDAGLDAWLRARGVVGITGVDTRALTALIRERGMPNAILAHDPAGTFDRAGLVARAAAIPSMEGLDLVPPVTSPGAATGTRRPGRSARATAAARARPGPGWSPSTTASSATSCASSPRPAARSRSCPRPRARPR